MEIYYLIFLVLLLSSVIDVIDDKLSHIFFIINVVVLLLLVSLKSGFVSRDYYNYLTAFDNIQYFSDVKYLNMEPGVLSIVLLLKCIGLYSSWVVFFLVALFGLTLKAKGILKLSNFPNMSLLIVYSTIYFRQDFTQIRASIAVGVFFIAIIDISHGQRCKYFLKIILASLFHVSALLYLPCYFFNKKYINILRWLLVLWFTFFLTLLKINVIEYIPAATYFDKLKKYSMLTETGAAVGNFVSIGNFLYILIASFFIIFAKRLAVVYEESIIIVKIFSFGMILYYLSYNFSTPVAGRILELFIGSIAFLMVYLNIIFKQKYVVIVAIAIYSYYFFNLTMLSGAIGSYATS